ncbi:MAG: Na+/H+ antiporter [Candidatus Kapabacteria bacterium]|jgi:CPA1 family monovalent cation:H+ antiporter|nr:Na+/H+ antiporter [Candidatus Kapabacteria bacterium]
MENIAIVVLLLFGVTFLAIVSDRLKFPFPIALVIIGLGISLIPNLPTITLDPNIVFLVFLPPLLYSAAWYTSWHEFKASVRPISLAAFGLVFFTTGLVGVAAHWLIPGLGWAEAFLLGAIVSPPDAVAATAVTKGLGLQPRMIAILEGESLLNDASGLIAYKYAIAAVMTGAFSLVQASGQFVVVVAGGVVIGLLVGYGMFLIHERFVCDANVETTLTVLTPYAAYLLAESVHVSGVLAVVAAGLYLSYRSADFFTTDSRIQAYSVWNMLIFVLNGLVFILIGLQLPRAMQGLEAIPFGMLLWYGLAVSLVVIVVRFVWVVPAALLPRLLSKRIREREAFDKRNMVIFGWAGMRGVVSMAAALAIPLTVTSSAGGNTPFPNRNLIIFLTFCVVIFTLVVLGLTLPWLIRRLKMPAYSPLAEEYETRMHVVNGSIAHIEDNFALVNESILARIKDKYEIKYKRLQQTDLPTNLTNTDAAASAPLTATDIFNQFLTLQMELIDVERTIVKTLRKEGKASDEVIRKIERELDLEEARLRMDLAER